MHKNIHHICTNCFCLAQKIWISALFEESYHKFLTRGKLSLFPALWYTTNIINNTRSMISMIFTKKNFYHLTARSRRRSSPRSGGGRRRQGSQTRRRNSGRRPGGRPGGRPGERPVRRPGGGTCLGSSPPQQFGHKPIVRVRVSLQVKKLLKPLCPSIIFLFCNFKHHTFMRS